MCCANRSSIPSLPLLSDYSSVGPIAEYPFQSCYCAASSVTPPLRVRELFFHGIKAPPVVTSLFRAKTTANLKFSCTELCANSKI